MFKRTAWVILTADWHVNSTIGLCPPSVPLDDGGSYEQSPSQQWLWATWLSFWQEVKRKRGHRVSVVLGDVVESFHHGTVQVVTLNDTTQERMAEEVAAPMLDAVDEVYVLRGTEAHVGGAGHKEERFAEAIGAVQNEERGTFSWWHLAREFGGVKFDLAHHPRTMSYVPHTRHWAAARQATYTWTEYMEDGIQPPDVIGRGHGHRWSHGYHEETYCVYVPPWQLTTSFGFRKGAGRKVEKVGGVLFECRNGEYLRQTIREVMPRPAPW